LQQVYIVYMWIETLRARTLTAIHPMLTVDV